MHAAARRLPAYGLLARSVVGRLERREAGCRGWRAKLAGLADWPTLRANDLSRERYRQKMRNMRASAGKSFRGESDYDRRHPGCVADSKPDLEPDAAHKEPNVHAWRRDLSWMYARALAAKHTTHSQRVSRQSVAHLRFVPLTILDAVLCVCAHARGCVCCVFPWTQGGIGWAMVSRPPTLRRHVCDTPRFPHAQVR
jgi:hypothetical protein